MTAAKKQNMNDNDKERTSLFISKDKIRSLKYIGFMSEKTQTEIVDEALTDFILKWEKKNGDIPKKQ